MSSTVPTATTKAGTFSDTGFEINWVQLPNQARVDVNTEQGRWRRLAEPNRTVRR